MGNQARNEETLFQAALELKTPEERAAYLTRACSGDPQLRERIEALLQAASPTNDFLEKPAIPSLGDQGPRTTDHSQAADQPPPGTAPSPNPTIVLTVPIAEKPGDRIGHYKLLEQIGEGGCGVVYMADQTEPIRRRVALKVIKLGMDTKSVVARFEAERQALALMDHPNIAKVLDAGATYTGRPYFVMELVRGIKITDYCDQHSLNTKQRLDLFMQVCHAIQHAHQKGIIHRDIKPSNILVTLHDGVPVPKVIDFGIAKATQQPLTDKTVFTAFQQFIGTPAYMSPEQAELSGLDIDTRSDIYALGVLLYELLTGGVPFEQKELLAAGFDEMRRVIREQEPPRPSTRLSTLAAADLTTVAKQRQTQPPRLVHLVRGDLDWIVMKCLEKDRSRRYETATGLAQDVKRHLENEPVTAAAPGALYRVRKFIRRHRTGLATAAALVLLLIAGVTASVWQAVRATKAELQASTVGTVLDYMMDGMRREIALGRDMTVLREMMDQAVVRMRKELKDQPEVQAGLWGNIANGYWILGDYSKAEEIMRAALATAKQLHRGEHTAVADALDELGRVVLRNGKPAEAEAIYREALAMRRKLLPSDHEYVVGSLNDLASVLREQEKFVEAEALYREALALCKKRLGPEDAEVADSLIYLAGVVWQQGKFAEAETLYREELAVRKKVRGSEHTEVAQSLYNVAIVLWKQRKFAEAETAYREELAMRKKLRGSEHAEVAEALFNLAVTLRDQNKLTEAEALNREALALRKKLLGPDHQEIASSLRSLANVLWKQGKFAEAETTYREELAMRKKLRGSEHAEVADSLYNLAVTLRDQKKLAEAEALYREALAMQKKLLGPDRAEVAESLAGLSWVLALQGKFSEAASIEREALAMREKVLPPGHIDTAWSHNNLAWLLATCPAPELRDGRSAVSHAEKAVAATNRKVPNMLGTLAAAYAEVGQFEKAVSVQKEAIALLKDEETKKDFTSRLKLYELKTPYRERD